MKNIDSKKQCNLVINANIFCADTVIKEICPSNNIFFEMYFGRPNFVLVELKWKKLLL